MLSAGQTVTATLNSLCGVALVHAACRRHVGVIAADGHADMAVAADQIIGRIEGDPSQPRHKRFDPGMRRAFDAIGPCRFRRGETCSR